MREILFAFIFALVSVPVAMSMAGLPVHKVLLFAGHIGAFVLGLITRLQVVAKDD